MYIVPSTDITTNFSVDYWHSYFRRLFPQVSDIKFSPNQSSLFQHGGGSCINCSPLLDGKKTLWASQRGSILRLVLENFSLPARQCDLHKPFAIIGWKEDPLGIAGRSIFRLVLENFPHPARQCELHKLFAIIGWKEVPLGITGRSILRLVLEV
ncbi:hypothetical protein CEXT_115021 [Caerostris extrusa]|uniref:LAGLIDADG homing endonuclease n=1 Tax=Caerostris extrusa TaxID=172846 RepID=A0AAV4QNT0_CAEEX|nr:hypothetical protein CEXT_115021 [Caerostris extrusa]